MKKLITTIILSAAAVGSIFSQSTPAKSDAALLGQADQIATETQPGANTALRVGNMFKAIIVSKPNKTFAFQASGTDTYTGTPLNPISGYTNGDMFLVYFPNANTGAATMNIGGFGARPLVNNKGEALTAGVIPAGSYHWLIYNSTSNHFKVATLDGVTGGGGSGTVESVTGSVVDNTDPANPVINAQAPLTFGTGVETALGVNIGSAGAPVLFNGAGGMPSSLTGTNITGIPLATGITTSITGILKGNGTTVEQAEAGTDYENPLTFSAPLSRATNTVSIPASSGSQNGYLSSTDYSEFNTETFIVACSDEITAITTGTGKTTFRMPRARTLSAVRASLTTAQASGSIFTVDINENGTTILSTKLTIDNTEKTSTTAVTPAVISDSALADDSEITIDVDQVGASGATGLKITLIWN